MSTPTPVEDLSFEDALTELEGIVSELERGETPLDDSIARFERGMALSRRCEARLNEAETKLSMLVQKGNQLEEVDMKTGESLGSPLVDEAPAVEPADPAATSPAQQSLIGGSDDDDLPF